MAGPEVMVALAVFFLVYAGMIAGGLPFLQLDRTGVALLGAIALVGAEVVTPPEAVRAIDLATVAFLSCPSWLSRRSCGWEASTPR